MAADKNSFVLYCDLIHTVRKLPKDKQADLFIHILSYVNDENPVTEDMLIEIVFEPIKQQLKRDLKKYENTIDRNRKNGSLGGRPRKKEDNPNNPLGFSETQITHSNPLEPKKADSDSVNDNVSDTVSVSVNETDFLLEKETKESIVVISSKKEIPDYEAIVQIFNSVCINLPKVSKLSDKRKSALKNRISESSLEALGDVFKKVAESRFLNGENKNGWKADFDWILNPSNYLKISEDNYKNPDHGTRNYNSTPTDAEIKKSANDAVDKMFGITRSS